MYPTLAGFTNQRSIDNVAATLYPDDAPLDFKPVTCYGDGNCLFRAFSIIFFGNEDHHTEFCIRAVCELAKNEKDYLSNYYLHSLMGAKNVVENLLPSSVFVNVKDSSSSYRRDVLRTLKSFTFAHMWHMFSLANVLGCTVQSVYPDVQNPGTNRFLLDISIRPAVAASTSTEPSVRLQDAAWATVKGKSKIGKRKAETPKMATSQSKKKPLNFTAPLDQATSLPTQPLVQQSGSPKAKPKDAVPHPQSKQDTASAGSPANESARKEKQPSVQQSGSPKAKPKSAVPHSQSKQDTASAGSPANKSAKKKKYGAANYNCTYKKDWTKELT
ncbi:hypothetical protein OS493_037024 [Desmophyllum pertusum]|uniref:OTU domain-containing protein n=1 Tax=Desmophyllum pertusum TaxID=174260 RepID=A0A9W9YI43_9CNID|nr:hypothetical protein OS493_037024 [Desmophyllum pertusum]